MTAITIDTYATTDTDTGKLAIRMAARAEVAAEALGMPQDIVTTEVDRVRLWAERGDSTPWEAAEFSDKAIAWKLPNDTKFFAAIRAMALLERIA